MVQSPHRQPRAAVSIAVGPLVAKSAVAPMQSVPTEPFVLDGEQAVDPVRTTLERPVFEHSLSWWEFQQDPNRYAAQIFMGNGNFTETGITVSAPPMKDKQRAGYSNVYHQLEYAAAFKAGVSVFRTTDVQGGRTVANSCSPHLPYLSYTRVREPGQPYWHNALQDRERFELVNSADPAAIRNGVRTGTVSYTLELRDRQTGHSLTQTVEKFASFADPAIACTRLQLVADFAGELIVSSGFDGTLINNAYDGYNQFQQIHTERGPDGAQVFGPQLVGLSLQTVRESEENISKLAASEYQDNPASTTPAEVRNQRQYQFGLAKRLRYFLADGAAPASEIHPELLTAAQAGETLADGEREIYVHAKLHIKPGQRLIVEDTTALVSSIDQGASERQVLAVARQKVARPSRYDALREAHVAAWQQQFAQARLTLFGGRRATELQAALDLCRAVLLRTVSGHNAQIAADMGAKGLRDGRYRTHNFWEMAVLFWKVKAIQDPAAAKGLARLYIQNIESARAYARSMGRTRGAQFGWQTTADGKPDTQVVKWNGVAQQWDPDFSKYQPHNNWAFFYGIDQVYRVSGDRRFLLEAMPLLVELVRFGADCCSKQADGKYHTTGMMDPNEFNEKLPGSRLPNLPDSFYNNFMIAKMASRLFELLEQLEPEQGQGVLAELAVDAAELEQIRSLATNMYFPITTEPKQVPVVDLSGNIHAEHEVPSGTIENYHGFTDLPMIHWPSMRGWIAEENQRRVALGKPELKPHFTAAGVVPRADQVLKAVELRAKLAELVADIFVRKGRWEKRRDSADSHLVLVTDRATQSTVWKLDTESDTVFAGAVDNADIAAYRAGSLDPQERSSVKPLLNTPDNFQVGKQQGSLQTVANFSAQEVVELLRANGYAVDLQCIARNLEYYDKCVNTNGSSLANVGTGAGKIGLGELQASVSNYDAVVHLDAKDTEPGTARQGIRAGNMAASELMLLMYLGLELDASGSTLHLDPRIPRDIGGIELLNAALGEQRLYLSCDGQHGVLRVHLAGQDPAQQPQLILGDVPHRLRPGETRTFAISQSTA